MSVAGCCFMHDETGTIKVDYQKCRLCGGGHPFAILHSRSLDSLTIMELRKLSTPAVCDTDMAKNAATAILLVWNIAPVARDYR